MSSSVISWSIVLKVILFFLKKTFCVFAFLFHFLPPSYSWLRKGKDFLNSGLAESFGREL